MDAMRPTQEAVRILIAGLAVLLLLSQPPAYGEPVAAKSDRLVTGPAKSDLLDREAERAEPSRPAPAAKAAFASRGSAARKMIDVAFKSEGLWLNSFATRSMPLEALDCAVLSDEIVSSLALPAKAVRRLAEEELMRQTRVCAVNGSVLLTCYGGAATVSLRPPQLGDGCGG